MSARLFVAVELAEQDRDALAAWAEDAVGEDAGMRPVERGQLHLTLAFLGHRSMAELDELAAAVEELDPGPAPELRTAGALWLAPRRPHVLTVAVADPSGRLGRLHERLWTVLQDCGVTREQRPFRPHVTVARVRRGWTAPTHPLPPVAPRALTAAGVVLFRSYLGGGPARYEAQARAGFSGDS